MEKQGVIKAGLTPPEEKDDVKKAAVATPAQLEQDPTRRMADTVASKLTVQTKTTTP